jgi:hypothetical protein
MNYTKMEMNKTFATPQSLPCYLVHICAATGKILSVVDNTKIARFQDLQASE